MGEMVTARCDCGYEAEASVGAGMSDFEWSCAFPCLCSTCGTLVEVDVLAIDAACPDCGSLDCKLYDDPELYRESPRESTDEEALADGSGAPRVASSWNARGKLDRQLKLMSTGHYCPACRRYELGFEYGGSFD